MSDVAAHYTRVRRGGNNTAVVFVHGLFGHFSKTWGEFPNLLAQDSRLAHCDLICWGYPSDLRIPRFARLPLLGRRLPELEAVSRALATDLVSSSVGGSYGDLVLVGHSMGGLVIMQMILELLRGSARDATILPRLRHLVLYATPTDGVQLPRVARAHGQARSIAMDSRLISSIRRDWVDRIRTVRAEDPVSSGKLYLPVTAVAGLEDAAVSFESVASIFQTSHTAPGSHTGVVKPTSRDDISFQLLRTVLLGYTTPRLVEDEKRLLATNRKIVNEATEVIFTTGSRSRDEEYLRLIESRLKESPALRYYRVLMGQPRRQQMLDHLHRILSIRNPADRSHGYKTTHLAVYDKPHEQSEVFLCGNERMCVVILPSLTGLGKYNSAEVFTGPTQVSAYRSLVEQLYHAGVAIETQDAVDGLKITGD